MKCIRLKVRKEFSSWLAAAAEEVNQVWNWANATSIDASDRGRRSNAKWLSSFDLDLLSSGASGEFNFINSNIIQRINSEYVSSRRASGKRKLRWRVSRGGRRSLGWVPFKAKTLRKNGKYFRFCGKSFRFFEAEKIVNTKWLQGCFSEDSVGDWWLCLSVETANTETTAPREAVGIDLGIKTIATTSDGETLKAGRWTQKYSTKLAMAQRHGHKKQAKLIHRKIARCRGDALHKFSRYIIDSYQLIVVGDVSSTKLAKTKMAKSVMDSGWGMLKAQLQYKGQQAGRSVSVVNESYTSVTCSSCGSRSGPSGVNGLTVRSWICSECGDSHDRDVNSARNILIGSGYWTSICGNGSGKKGSDYQPERKCLLTPSY